MTEERTGRWWGVYNCLPMSLAEAGDRDALQCVLGITLYVTLLCTRISVSSVIPLYRTIFPLPSHKPKTIINQSHRHTHTHSLYALTPYTLQLFPDPELDCLEATPTRYRPVAIEQLSRSTRFSRQELQFM